MTREHSLYNEARSKWAWDCGSLLCGISAQSSFAPRQHLPGDCGMQSYPEPDAQQGLSWSDLSVVLVSLSWWMSLKHGSAASPLSCKFVFFMSRSPPTTGLGGALRVCREFLNSSGSGSPPPSRVGPALPRGMFWKWEIRKRCGVAQASQLAGLHWYSACVQHLRQLPIVIVHWLG